MEKFGEKSNLSIFSEFEQSISTTTFKDIGGYDSAIMVTS